MKEVIEPAAAGGLDGADVGPAAAKAPTHPALGR